MRALAIPMSDAWLLLSAESCGGAGRAGDGATHPDGQLTAVQGGDRRKLQGARRVGGQQGAPC